MKAIWCTPISTEKDLLALYRASSDKEDLLDKATFLLYRERNPEARPSLPVKAAERF